MHACVHGNLLRRRLKAFVDEEPRLKEQANQPLEETNEVFYDTHKDIEQKQQRGLELSKTQLKKQERKLHRALLRLRDGQQKPIKVQIM